MSSNGGKKSGRASLRLVASRGKIVGSESNRAEGRQKSTEEISSGWTGESGPKPREGARARPVTMPVVEDLMHETITADRERAFIMCKYENAQSILIQDLDRTIWTSRFLDSFSKRFLVVVTVPRKDGAEKSKPFSVERFEDLPDWLLREVEKIFHQYEEAARRLGEDLAVRWNRPGTESSRGEDAKGWLQGGGEGGIGERNVGERGAPGDIPEVSFLNFFFRVYPRRLLFCLYFCIPTIILVSLIYSSIGAWSHVLTIVCVVTLFGALSLLGMGDGTTDHNPFGAGVIRVRGPFRTTTLRYGDVLRGDTYCSDWTKEA